jgi:glycosyltransferase involved in cell wall biosynthesis
MSTPVVSVVIPTRNRVDLLRGAVKSVMQQSEDNFELIVVDDASSDGTPQYLAALAAADARVRVVRNAVPLGGPQARNSGISSARGRWVAFLDDDDEWLPAKLSRQLQMLAADSSAVACSCHYIHRPDFGRSRVIGVPSVFALQQLLFDNPLGSASLCIGATPVLREIGGFDSRLHSGQDQDLWVRLFARGKVLVCAEPLVRYRSHAGPRISNDFGSQYAGARRFYFKHRAAMDESVRRRRVAYSCFLMSRQTTRTIRRRAWCLATAVRNATAQDALRYLRSSVPRLVLDAVRGSSAPPAA